MSEGVIVHPEVAVIFHPDTGQDPATLDVQNQASFLLIESLVDSHVSAESADKEGSALGAVEAKLDLLITLVNQLLAQQQPAPNCQSVRLSAQGIEWQSSATLPSRGCLELFLEPTLPRSISLMVENRILSEQAEGVTVCSRFHYLAPEIQAHLEKWIFRHHRREIAQQRHGHAPG